MARIRTIKPEFFADEDLAACSPHARLLAIALLQICDKNGVFRNVPMQVHAHAFPWEATVKIQVLLGELEQVGYMKSFEHQGKQYGFLPGFTKHQRLSGKEAQSAGLYPTIDQADQQVTPSDSSGSNGEAPECFTGKRTGAQEREREREREKGEGLNRPSVGTAESVETETDLLGDSTEANGKTPPCPHRQIIALYHEALPELPAVNIELWNGQRQQHLQARWREHPAHQSLDYWRDFFAIVRTNPHWMGDNDRGWKADMGWLVKPANFVKVVERGMRQ